MACCRFVLCNLGDTLTEDEIEELLQQADHDNDGRITYDGRLSQHIPLSVLSVAIRLR